MAAFEHHVFSLLLYHMQVSQMLLVHAVEREHSMEKTSVPQHQIFAQTEPSIYSGIGSILLKKPPNWQLRF